MAQTELQKKTKEEVLVDDWLPITSSRNAKWWYSAFHNVTAMVGAGVLSLPYAMAELGWYFFHVPILNLAFFSGIGVFYLLLEQSLSLSAALTLHLHPIKIFHESCFMSFPVSSFLLKLQAMKTIYLLLLLYWHFILPHRLVISSSPGSPLLEIFRMKGKKEQVFSIYNVLRVIKHLVRCSSTDLRRRTRWSLKRI